MLKCRLGHYLLSVNPKLGMLLPPSSRTRGTQDGTSEGAGARSRTEWLLGLVPSPSGTAVRAGVTFRRDALARGHLPRTGKAGVPSQGVALGDRRRHPGPDRRE